MNTTHIKALLGIVSLQLGIMLAMLYLFFLAAPTTPPESIVDQMEESSGDRLRARMDEWLRKKKGG